jgi:hypothetical protein
MPEFYLINERRFPLNVTMPRADLLSYHRWEHRVTIGHSGRRFMVCLDNLLQTVYIEEITSGQGKRVEDDSLFEGLATWARDEGYLDIMLPMLKNADERFV